MANAAKAREANAARQLIAAYRLAASETGEFMAGYDRTVGEVHWPDGTMASGPIAHRYPFRLGPYYDYQLDGIILVNENAKQVNASNTYNVSLSPAFGINYLFVGGDRAGDGTLNLPGEVVTRPGSEANLIAFASAGRSDGGPVTHGFNLLTPPQIHGAMWSNDPWTPGANPDQYGFLDARHADQVMIVFLDGSVRLKDVEQLRDMRLWSMRAAQNDDPNYTVDRPPRPPGGRR